MRWERSDRLLASEPLCAKSACRIFAQTSDLREAIAVRLQPCPCCGFLTFPSDEPVPGSFLICDICRWEDDDLQFSRPDYQGGANKVSLNEARENFLRLGVSDPSRRGRERPPTEQEIP